MSEPMSSEQYLTVREIATLLKLSPQTIRNMIDRGDLPVVRIGSRRVRVLRSDLDDFLSERRRLTSRSDLRVSFDDEVAATAKTLRGKDGGRAAEGLRSMSEAALALAGEIDGTGTSPSAEEDRVSH